MTIIDIIKAFLIGICVSLPIGPVGILAIQNSFAKGRRSGFVTGLGATTVDSTWAVVSVFFLSLAETLIAEHSTIIAIIGGLVMIGIGLSMGLANPFRQLDKQTQMMDHVSPKDYLKSLAIGFSNPGAIFIMFALFAGFNVNVSAEDGYRVIFVIMALATGSALYWFGFSSIFGKLRRAVNLKAILWVNRTAGAAVFCFGVFFMLKGLLALL